MTPLHLVLGLIVVALLALVAWWFFFYRKKESSPENVEQSRPNGAVDIDLAIHDAEVRLAAAKLGQGTRIRDLPVFLFVGAAGAGKTSVMLQSGVEPELLSGQVYENSDVIPTQAVNIWFARGCLFIEAGGEMPDDPGKWSRLLRRVVSRTGVVGRAGQAPRAVV